LDKGVAEAITQGGARMTRHWRRSRLAAAMVALVVLAGLPAPARAQLPETPNFGSLPLAQLWLELDYPVAAGVVRRSFFYGPALTLHCQEPYVEGGDAQGNITGRRPVYYLDKGRLEELNPGTISAGLLAKELISGRRQLGDDTFAAFPPAEVAVAGDPGAAGAPTYASFARVATIADPTVNRAPRRVGQAVTETIDRAGRVGADADLARYGVTLAAYREELGHNVPGVFVEFFLRPGLVAQYGEDGKLHLWERAPLLIDWTDTIGLPVAEPYWAQVPVGGQVRWVLMQPFERRVMTYTPDNPAEFRVEMGNIGQHYKAWRHPDGTCRE
jgi:hypothetical protein